MKRIVAILLALTMVFALCACGGNIASKEENTGSKPEEENTDSKPNENEIKTTLRHDVSKLSYAYGYCSSTASIIMSHWEPDDTLLFSKFFSRTVYDSDFGKRNGEAKNADDRDLDEAWHIKDKAKELLDETLKDLKGLETTDSTKDYYEAVKTYYKAVDALYSLISKWPEGYNALTYAQAITDAKASCESAKSELSFY